MVGRTVSHYRILAELGRGGMGVLYRARDERLGRDVALKFLPESAAQNRAAGDRFLREARAASALNHPSICTLHDIGEDEGRPFLVLELLEGETLRATLNRGPLEIDRLQQVAVSLLNGLQAAHSRGIIHRDIKPENIFLTSSSSVKLLDFGLAKLTDQTQTLQQGQTELTMPGSLLGTVSYMSPEQLRGETVDERTDLYSLGMVLYEAATGTICTRKETIAASLAAVLTEAPPRASELRTDLPASLDELIFRSTRKALAARFRSAAEMLDRLSEGGPEPGTAPSLGAPAKPARIEAPRFDPAARRPLVGRQEERRMLQELLRDARRGHGKMVLIEGEPGIGKTRLLEFVLAAARDNGMRTMVGRCSELETGTPFLPFVEVLDRLARESDPATLLKYLGPLAPEIGRLTPRIRRVLPDIPSPLEVPPERERHLLFSAVTEWIERLCGEQPVVLGLEDLHWADAATSALVQHLGGDLSSLPLLIVGTRRAHSTTQNGGFATALGQLLRHRVIRRVVLERFGCDDVDTQLRHIAGSSVPPQISHSICQITEGNPFFVEELFDHLLDEGLLFDASGRWKTELSLDDFGVPEGILLVLGRRLERLSEEAHDLLQAAAVMGRTFRFDLLAQCLEKPPSRLIESLEEAGRLGLVLPASENGEITYAFSHALVRQSLIDLMSPPRRQAIHLRVADVLEAFDENGDGTTTHAIDVAHHLTAAGSMAPASRKMRFLAQAGDEALAKTAFQEADDFYERATAFVRRDPGMHGNLLFKKGLAMTGLARWREAHKAWIEALDLLEAAGDRARFGELSDVLSSQLIWLGQLEAAHRVSRKGISVLGDADEVRRVRLLAWAGNSRSQEGRLAEGSPLTEEAMQTARRLNRPRLLGHIYTQKACEAFYRMRYDDAASSGKQAAELLAGYPWDQVEGAVFHLCGLLGVGQLSEIRSSVEEWQAVGSRIGHMAGLWMLKRVVGMTDLLEFGNLTSLKDFASQDLELCRMAGLKWISEAHSWLGLAEWWAGDLEAAGRQFEQAAALEPSDFSHGADSGCRIAYLGFAGRRAEVLDLLSASAVRRSSSPQTAGGWNELLLTIQGLAWLEEWDRIGALYPVVKPAMELGSAVLFNAVGLVETVVALAAAAAGEWEAAERHFESAARTARTIPCRIEQPEIRRWHAELLLRRNLAGDRERARQLLADARRGYEEIGMPLHQRLCERRLAGGPARLV